MLKPSVNEQDHIEGNQDATIELVEYGDYQCPHCGKAYGVVKKLQHTFGDNVKLIFRNFPLAKIHPQATIAAVATEAAGLQGKFWEMHDIVFENQDYLEEDGILSSFASDIDIDVAQFEQDLQREDLLAKVEADFESGIRSGVNATPTFFINGVKYNNGWEGDRIEEYIRENVLK